MKIAAFDFDGTLPFPGRGPGAVFDRLAFAVIDAWRNAGHLALCATGRRDLIFSYQLDPAVLEAAVNECGGRKGAAVFATTDGDVDGVFANNTGETSSLTDHFTPMTHADIPLHRFAVVPLRIPVDTTLRAEAVAWARGLERVTVAQNHTYVDIMAPGHQGIWHRPRRRGALHLRRFLERPAPQLPPLPHRGSRGHRPRHRVCGAGATRLHVVELC